MKARFVFTACLLLLSITARGNCAEPSKEAEALFAQYIAAFEELRTAFGKYSQFVDFQFTDDQMRAYQDARIEFRKAEEKRFNAIVAYKRYIDSAGNYSQGMERLNEWKALEKRYTEARPNEFEKIRQELEKN